MGNELIIGLVGAQGSGKDEAANYIEKNFDFKHIKFAKLLNDLATEFGMGYTNREDKEVPKEMTWVGEFNRTDHPTAYRAFGSLVYEAEYLFTRALRPYLKSGYRYELSPRTFLQIIGTEVGRELNPDVWVDATLDNEVGNLVISDVRFLNEARCCDFLVYVVREGCGFRDKHKSEEFGRQVHDWFMLGGTWESSVETFLDYKMERSGLYVLLNDGSLEDLGKRLDLMLESINA